MLHRFRIRYLRSSFFHNHARDSKGYICRPINWSACEGYQNRHWLPGILTSIQQWATSSRKIATHEAVHLSMARREEEGRDEVAGTLTNNALAGLRIYEEWHSFWTNRGWEDMRIKERGMRALKNGSDVNAFSWREICGLCWSFCKIYYFVWFALFRNYRINIACVI